MHQQPGADRHSLPELPDMPDSAWAAVLAARHGARLAIDGPWETLWSPLIDPRTGGSFVLGQLGQSLDGRTATATGHSHYINGPAAITHLHRLRALVDAVVVGVGTVVADDPQLTVRHVSGPNPVRVVLDPRGRIPPGARLLREPGRAVVVTLPGVSPALPPTVEISNVAAATDGAMSPAAIVASLAERGLRRLLIEGGAATLSRFLAAACVHRLHLAVAPMIIGSGPVGLSLPTIDRLDQALRGRMQAWRLGEDLLLDFDLAQGK
jgi:diaminohydroxyphosphoribosylaminopyrimidine deaminase/5-amino-6-(5-phosphoribosylamino)uracil reductase